MSGRDLFTHFMATMVVTGFPRRCCSFLVLADGQRAAALQGHAVHALQQLRDGRRALPRHWPREYTQGSGLHLHVKPRLQPGPARAGLADSGAHFGLHEALADESAGAGYGLPSREFIAVDRSGNAADARTSVAAAQQVLAKGVHMTTFVEGTRSPDGRMMPFKKGPFFLAMAAARRASRSRSMGRRRFWVRAACA